MQISGFRICVKIGKAQMRQRRTISPIILPLRQNHNAPLSPSILLRLPPFPVRSPVLILPFLHRIDRYHSRPVDSFFCLMRITVFRVQSFQTFNHVKTEGIPMISTMYHEQHSRVKWEIRNRYTTSPMISLASLKCRGFDDRAKKMDVFHYVQKNKSDIICLVFTYFSS